MGNRAVITNKDEKIGVYLHWNGGRDSVEAFLKYCKLQGYRTLTEDPAYGFAHLVQVIANYIGGGLSVGIGRLEDLDCDNGDNGMYIVDGWTIVDRKYHSGPEQKDYSLLNMLLSIDDKQPNNEQLGEEFIRNAIGQPKEKEKDVIIKAVEELGDNIKEVDNGYEIKIVNLPNDGTYTIFIDNKEETEKELYARANTFEVDDYVISWAKSEIAHPTVRALLEDAEAIEKHLYELATAVTKALQKKETK